MVHEVGRLNIQPSTHHPIVVLSLALLLLGPVTPPCYPGFAPLMGLFVLRYALTVAGIVMWLYCKFDSIFVVHILDTCNIVDNFARFISDMHDSPVVLVFLLNIPAAV